MASSTLIEIGSIPQIHLQLVNNGYQISEYTLRLWTKDGTLGYIPCGNRRLISYSAVIDILNSATKCC